MVYLTGSYARGDANDNSDLDVFCIFSTINQYVLETVGNCARNTSIPYDLLEINTQSLSVDEYKSKIFGEWSEYAVTELNSVLLYGEQLVEIENINEKILSYFTSRTTFSVCSKSSSLSPGNPTIISLVIAIPGIFPRM